MNDFWQVIQDRGLCNIALHWGDSFKALQKRKSSIFSPKGFTEEIECDAECPKNCSMDIKDVNGKLLKYCPERRHAPEEINPIDSLLYSINLNDLHGLLCDEFGLNTYTGISKIIGAHHTYMVGTAPMAKDFSQRTYFAIYANQVEKLKRSIDSIIRQQAGKTFCVLLPTAKYLDTEINVILNQSNGLAIILSEEWPLQQNGHFGSQEILNVKEVPPDYNVRKRFPTPENCSWSDFEIEFVSLDEICVRVEDVERKYHYRELGFVDTRRNEHQQYDKQWQLFMKFGSPSGCVEYELNPWMKKAKEKLSVFLREFTGLSQDPIQANRRTKTYECLFTVILGKNVIKSGMILMDK